MTIRRVPEDFRVEELLTEAAQALVRPEPGPHALYHLTKKSLTTPNAISDLTRKLKVRPGDVAFVGLKDKHAVTSQYVTARRGGDAPTALEGGAWQARRLGFLPRPLDADMVAGNRFILVVRGLSREASERMDEHIQLLADPLLDPPGRRQGEGACINEPRTSASGLPAAPLRSRLVESPPAASSLLVVNYFGDQRFGSARHFQGFAAPYLIRGDFAQALKLTIATPSRKDKKDIKVFRQRLAAGWGDFQGVLPQLPRCADRRAIEHLSRRPDDFRGAFVLLPYFTQQMAVYSYQSHLWNAIARRLLLEACPDPRRRYEADDPFGPMLFAAAQAVPAAWRDLDLPVPGRNTQPVEPWSRAALAVLREEGLQTFRDLKIPGVHRPFFGEAPRQWFMRAREFTLSQPQRDELEDRPHRLKRTVGFSLPRGGYATVVLRALGQ